jgi:cupin fold WbuC family metalloprotein
LRPFKTKSSHPLCGYLLAMDGAGSMKLITGRMIDELITKAGQTQRLRTNYNIHDSLSDPVQRLFIAAEPSTYFRPHSHTGKCEFAIVLRGLFDILIFDNAGVVMERISVGADSAIFALEIPSGVCHTWIPMVKNSVFFEVKQGPYDPETSLIFAPWAPEEGSAQVGRFQSQLLIAGIGDRAA